MTKNLIILLCFLVLFNCENKKKVISNLTSQSEIIKPSKAELIINEAIEAHGGKLYDSAKYSFDFRGNTYIFNNSGHEYEYKKTILKNDSLIEDVLKNGKFSRLTNSMSTKLNTKTTTIAANAVNSVIYFATLPHKLGDKAVNKTYIGETTIKEKKYHIIKITFDKEDGGHDFEDEYYYWINSNTKKIDYLAYNYKVNNGGVRFRSAYNVRDIDGITFQDYINYKAEVGTPLNELPKLYKGNKLKELSRIKTENIINLNKN